MDVHPKSDMQKVRTLFVSDIHLGCRFAQPENFLSYLESVEPETIYILGDFLDGWKLKSSWFWKPVYTRIINRLLTLARNGTRLYYTPGNHDAFLRCSEVQKMVRETGVNIQVADEFIFEACNGKRFLLTHGDKFDVIEMNYQWLSVATGVIYEPLLFANWVLSKCYQRKPRSPYGACAVIKDRVKAAVRFISSFESRLYAQARRRGCDGIVCGHIHSPGMIEEDSITYLNTGDWVENCTALVEYEDGAMVLESFFSHIAPIPVLPAPADLSETQIPEIPLIPSEETAPAELPQPVAVA